MRTILPNLKQASALIVCFLLGAVAGRAVVVAEPDIRRDPTVIAIEQVMPSVVNIATRTVVPVRDVREQMFRRFYGQPSSDTQVSLGSGVIIDEAGYLLTNDHVVRGTDQIGVKFNTGTNLYEATIVASDPKSDVALLKLKARPGEKFRAIKLANEDDLLLGETVLAMGNPYGLGGSVSRGILSSKSRAIPKEGASLKVGNWLQTDAPINPGNSGGALINLRGELIGINVAVFNETEQGQPVQGIGFAIPIKLVEEALADILPTEFVKSLWFGARVKVGTSPLVITSVQRDSPAGRAGLKPNDVILQVNDHSPKSFIDFSELLGANANKDIAFTVQRDGEEKRISVRLVPVSTDMIRQKLGITLEARTLQMPRGPLKTFMITAVQKGMAGEEAGLQTGMFIMGFDGQAADDLTSLAKSLYGKQKGDGMQLYLLTIKRETDSNVSVQEWIADLTLR